MAAPDDGDESFFRNTSRRWIFDEQEQLARRYVHFNVAALKQVVALALNRECVHMSKLTEGGFNKIFVLTMEGGDQVIARIPSPIAGTPGHTTASEVATMDYLRNHLAIPVPRVIAWDYRTDKDNAVGAEYIVMEKIEGDILASRWNSLSSQELGEVIQEIVRFESRILMTRFPKYGSLYYTDYVEQRFRDCEIKGRFCVGPIATKIFWDDKRSQLKLDRGPWLLAEDYLKSIADREIACTAKFGTSRRPLFYSAASTGKIESKDYITLLSQYRLVAPYLIPRERKDLSYPTLQHPDLNLNNIILRPNSTQIAGIIDWQWASILPFFIQAGFPALCGRPDGELPKVLKLPQVPDNFESMDLEQQIDTWKNVRQEKILQLYTAATILACPRHMMALESPHWRFRLIVIKRAGARWDGDSVLLREALIYLRYVWAVISPHQSHPCPEMFTRREEIVNQEESDEWRQSFNTFTKVQKYIGIDSEGGTSPENYERACILNERFRMKSIEGLNLEMRDLLWKTWPFKDKNDDSDPPAPLY